MARSGAGAPPQPRRRALAGLLDRLEFTRDPARRTALREQLRQVIADIRRSRDGNGDNRMSLGGTVCPRDSES